MRTSWVPGSEDPESDFPLGNLPYGVFSEAGGAPRCGVAIGSMVLDLAGVEEAGLFGDSTPLGFSEGALNRFMETGPQSWARVRDRLKELLAADGSPDLRDNSALRDRLLFPLDQVQMYLPIVVRGYTDFYAGRQHAFNSGSILRGPKNALTPNWPHMPIAYNGRTSTVVVSGTPVRRPLGQTKPAGSEMPLFGPSKRLDIEVEFGAVVGLGTELGQTLTVEEAWERIFGFVLLNDWSARDLQAWEYVPLGPFNAKTFATTISPWVVTMAALEPFRVQQPAQSPEPLSYLRHAGKHAFDIQLEVYLKPEKSAEATRLSHTNFRYMYWSMAQQLAHHTVSGCNTNVGDLMGSGTISGPTRDSLGSLLELTWNGKTPLPLADGQTRSFIEDGDELILKGWCQGDGYRVGFGNCTGKVLPAIAAA